MASRREFLQFGIAASALPITGATGLSSDLLHSGAPARLPLYKVVFDERFADSVRFGVEMKRLGVPTHAIQGDITDFWLHDLDPRWKKAPVAIAGLTAHGPLFCLERLSWDHRMRVVFSAEHRSLGDGRIEHAISGPDIMLRHAAELVAGGPNWAAHIAAVVTHCPPGRSQISRTTIITPLATATDDEQEPLMSWVIAPVDAVRRNLT
jgi:hypothetical protein